MTITSFNCQELFTYLKRHGCREYECSDKTLDGNYVIFESPENELIPIQILKVYYPVHVREICQSAGIPTPAQFKKYFEQIGKIPKR